MTATLTPKRSIDAFGSECDELVRVANNGFAPTRETRDHILSRSNLLESWGSFFLQVALPGIESDELVIEIVARQVLIRGRYHVAIVDGGADLWRDIPTGPFEEIFRLPAEVDGDRAEARYARGILTVRLPKVAHLKPDIVKVHVVD